MSLKPISKLGEGYIVKAFYSLSDNGLNVEVISVWLNELSNNEHTF